MTRKNRRSDCPIHCGLTILGDRWTLTIVRDLMFTNRASFGELMTAPEKIASNILADRLAKLQHEDIVEKTSSGQYMLGDKGWDLAPLLIELAEWTQRHDNSVLTTKNISAEYRRSPDNFIAGLKQQRELAIDTKA